MTQPTSSPAPNRLQQFALDIIAPYSGVGDITDKRRAQLLNSASLVFAFTFFLALFARSANYRTFILIILISFAAYVLGKSRYYKLGARLFALGLLVSTHFSLFYSSSGNLVVDILPMAAITLILASVLVGPWSFLALVIYESTATLAAPIYAITPISPMNAIQAGWLVAVTGSILFGLIHFKKNIDNARMEQMQWANADLQVSKMNLEKRIEENSHELNAAASRILEKTKYLQIVAEISQTITDNANQSLVLFMTNTCALLSEKLGFYHVGIFLLDENREYAVLQAANSKGGQHMLQRRHQLKVGGAGIVGYVSQGGRPRIALDTGADAVFFNNPDLPETRSEMALPLKVGLQIIGVLDVQSSQAAAFEDEDVTILSTLVNQIALIIQNLQIKEGVEIESSSLQRGRRTVSFSQSENQKGLAYLPDGTLVDANISNDIVAQKAIASGETVILEQPSKGLSPAMAIPVKLRDQVIGIIHVKSSEVNRKWTEDEVQMIQSIAERAALALENARLFEETSRRAEQEHLVAEITSRIGESNNMEKILRTTIQELGRTLGTSRAFIQLETINSDEIGK